MLQASMVDTLGGLLHTRSTSGPTGTAYPENLVVKRGRSKRTDKPGTRNGDHYQSEPKNRMTVVAREGALDNFARSAVVQAIVLAKGK